MKRLIFFAVLIASALVINNLVRSIYSLWKKHDLIVQAKKEVEEQKKQNRQLSEKLKIVESQEFVEKEARNKLFMVKPGERMVVLPPIAIEEKKEKVELPNWKKWWQLFF